MRQDLLEYYERELAYVRQLGSEFAERYPRIASRLLLEPDRCEDPHVERLIESFAFLTARIHLRLDDDLPEVTAAMLQLVYPHYLRPLPAMSVAECQVDSSQGKQSARIEIPSGTVLTTKRTIEGMPCRFKTSYPVELWPFRVADCTWRQPEQIPRPLRVPGAAAVMRVVLRAGPDVDLSALPLESLRIYLSGEIGVVQTLYEVLSRNCVRIAVRDPRRPDKVVEIASQKLKPAGLEEDEALLPYPRRSFDGYRLLQEYFSFPEKFLFFTLGGLEVVSAFAGAEELELLLYFSRFDRPERMQTLEVGVSTNTIRLGCTPIINLFQQAAEPILLSQSQHEYRVIPDTRHQHMMEIFSVDGVLATSPSRRTTTPIDPLYAYRYQTSSASDNVFWHSTRRYASLGERRPSDTYVALVDVDGALAAPNAEVLTVQTTCTNHDLPSRLSFNASEGDFDAEGFAMVNRIRALHRPTPSIDPPQGRGQLWRLISQLSLNYLSITEEGLPALQEILRVHNFAESPHLENQIGGLSSLKTRSHFALMSTEFGGVPARGTRVELQLDERQFTGGGAYLFASVLNRFLGNYATMNSFCQLAVWTNLRKEMLGEWPPRSGSQVLI
jgi:type VI secretion system protein ImpG